MMTYRYVPLPVDMATMYGNAESLREIATFALLSQIR